MLAVLERKVLTKIYGSVRGNDGWIIQCNLGMMQHYGVVDIAEFVKHQRLRWAGHFRRMTED